MCMWFGFIPAVIFYHFSTLLTLSFYAGATSTSPKFDLYSLVFAVFAVFCFLFFLFLFVCCLFVFLLLFFCGLSSVSDIQLVIFPHEFLIFTQGFLPREMVTPYILYGTDVPLE